MREGRGLFGEGVKFKLMENPRSFYRLGGLVMMVVNCSPSSMMLLSGSSLLDCSCLEPHGAPCYNCMHEGLIDADAKDLRLFREYEASCSVFSVLHDLDRAELKC